jgi:hypothetical protein
MHYVLVNIQNFVRSLMFYKLLLHCTNNRNSKALTSKSSLNIMYVIVTCQVLLLLFDFS